MSDLSAVSPWSAPDSAEPPAERRPAFPGTPNRPPPPSSSGAAPLPPLLPPSGYRRPLVTPPGPYPPRVGPPPGQPAWAPPIAPARSGLFPTPPHPTWRESFRAGGWAIVIGVLAGTVWMALLAALASTARSYVWWTVAAGVLGGLAAAALARLGDRGVATGVALACAIGVTISFIVVTVRWAGGDWLLW
jgi:hypothetical protein